MFLALTLLAGCSSWIDQQQACEYDVYDWSDDLVGYILAGDGSGAFDVDPEDIPRKKVKGSYDPITGDYSWSTSYADDYYLLKSEVVGFGTAFHNGNLDLKHTNAVTDVLGQIFEIGTRTQRTGCDMSSSTWSGDDQTSAFTWSGSYQDDDSFSWTADVPGYQWKGGMRRNLSSTETIDAEDGSYYSFSESKPEGYTDTEWTLVDGAYTYEATERFKFDGTTEGTQVISQDGETLDTCDYVIAYDQTCTYTCESGDSGDC